MRRSESGTWQAPAEDGGSALLRYEYRYAAGASVPADTVWTSAGTALSVAVNGLDNGTPYAFEVRAVNGVGNSPAVATTATPATVPDAPQNLAAVLWTGGTLDRIRRLRPRLGIRTENRVTPHSGTLF